MSKVIFKFDKDKDLWNNWHKCNWKSSWHNFNINPKLKEICKNKKLEEIKDELVEYLTPLWNSGLIEIEIDSIKKAWEKIEDEFFKRMNKIMKKEFEDNVIGYLTTLGICPYDPDEPSFMFSLFYPLPMQLSICGHEIMHLYFHKFYWNDVEKKIGKEKTGDLKEALTVLLNVEFRDLWFTRDRGYDSHKDLRKFILDEWNKEKDFEKLLDKCVAYLKNL